MSNADFERMILGNFPLVSAPHTGDLAEPEKFGMRFVVASSGLFREISTPWLYAIFPIAKVNGYQTPYGVCTQKVHLRCGNPPVELWAAFREAAMQALPNECAGAFIWNHVQNTWRFSMREATMVSPDQVDYNEVSCNPDEVLVVDIHSHGQHPAFFSSQDDQDDQGGMKVSAVIGQLASGTPTIALRLVCLDRMLGMRLETGGVMQVLLGERV